MSGLRRDLIERRLWPVVALLLLAVIAVPVLLVRHSSAAGAPIPMPPPATATAAPAAPHAPSAVQVKLLVSRIPRDPFASGEPKLATAPSTGGASTSSTSSSTTPASSSGPTTVASATAATAAATTSQTTTAAMVTPAPAPAPARTRAASSTTSVASTPTTTAASTTTSATPTSTTARAQTPPAAPAGSWTTYAVNLRFGADSTAPVRSDVERLTPLPSAARPDVMFMGVTAGGHQAVFALAAGVGHTGAGICRVSHANCSAILLAPGQSEQLTVPVAGGNPQQFVLRVTHIAGTVTHSQSVALAAYDRHSAVGLCELVLAEPMFYNSATGTLSSQAKHACDGQTAAVPFMSAG